MFVQSKPFSDYQYVLATLVSQTVLHTKVSGGQIQDTKNKPYGCTDIIRVHLLVYKTHLRPADICCTRT